MDQFEEGPFLSQRVGALMHKASSIKTWLDESGVEHTCKLTRGQKGGSLELKPCRGGGGGGVWGHS